MLTHAETGKAKFETEFGKPWRSKHLDIAVRKVTFCEHLLQCQTSKSRIRLAQERLIKDKKVEGDATVTRMNSWPTAPETPAIATLGPFESFAARMMRGARVGRRWKVLTARENGAWEVCFAYSECAFSAGDTRVAYICQGARGEMASDLRHGQGLKWSNRINSKLRAERHTFVPS